MGTEDKAVHDARKALDDYTAQIRATGQATPQTAAALAILNEQLADAQQAQRFAEGMRLASDEMWAVLEPVKQAPSAFAGLSAALAGIVPQQALDDLDAIRLKMLDAEAAFRQGKISAEEFAQLKLQGAQAQSTVQANAAASKTDVGLGVAAGLIGGSLSQALTPLLQTLGPQGAIAGAVLGLLEQGPEMITGIIDALPGLVTDIIGTVQTLIDTLPQTLVGLVEGVIGALPSLLLTVFELVYGPFVGELVIGLLEALPTIISGLVVGLTELAFQLPSILLDTARVVPVLVAAAADIVPMMTVGIIEAIPELWSQGREAFASFRADLVADLKGLVSRQDRKERERWGKVGEALKNLRVDLDGREVSRGLTRTADARKGNVRR
jgi:phage-related protein